jgi:N-acetylneuraminic acid mutarotase
MIADRASAQAMHHSERPIGSQTARVLAGLIVSALLSACGGGGGGSGAAPVPAPPPVPQTVTISGTVAAGAALTGTMSVYDSSTNTQPRTASTSIGADGQYSVVVTGFIPPFLLQATGQAGGQGPKVTLYSVATAGGTVNITPVTSLMALNMAAGNIQALTTGATGILPSLTAADLTTQNTNMDALLSPVLTTEGLNANYNFSTTAFTVGGVGYSQLLNAVTFNLVNPAAVTITENAAPGTPITIDTDAGSPNGTLDVINGPTTLPISVAIGGTITGLTASGLQLQNNGADTISVAPNATSFTFATAIASGAGYKVTVKTQPSGQSCVVSNGTGTAVSSNVTNAAVACTTNTVSTYSVGGTINGLTAAGLVIEDNGADDLSLAAGATTFTFATPLGRSAIYQVTVKTQPTGQTCSVANGSGSVGSGAITNVVVTCNTTNYTFGGTVSNLKGATLMLLLQNNGGYASNVVSVLPGQLSFGFGIGLPNGTGYNVTVQQQPSGQSCTVTKGAGTVSGSNVASINVSCVTVPQWAWISGDDTSLSAVYGIVGQAVPANSPGGRSHSATSIDTAGNLWLFGGGHDDGSLANDLWVYGPSTGEWSWVEGSSSPNIGGVYGTQGVSASGNAPGARFGAVSWTDTEGNFWLFGGQGYDSTGTQGWLNDLWEYSPATGQWLWVSGSSVGNATGVYGTAGVAAANNQPSGRYYAVGWIDAGNHLWLFGGAGIDANGKQNTLNDLWEFDAGTGVWTWINGSPSGYVTGVYGTQGVANGANAPGSRQQATAWTDSAGQLWLFGGYGLDAAGTYDALNDLWRYNSALGLWTWMGGSTIVDARGVYGVQGVAAATNIPGARYGTTSWIDVNGAFWLLGGEGYDSTSQFSNIQNDVWKYDSTSGNWTWMSGGSSDGGGDPGLYQVQGLLAAGNSPGARTAAISWADASGSWLYGGNAASPLKPGATSYTISQATNDLWHFGAAIFYNGTGSMTGTFTDQNGCQYPAPATIVNANVTMSTPSAGAVTVTFTVPALTSATPTCPSYGANSGSFSVPVTVNGTAMQSIPGSFGSVSATISGGAISGTVGFQETGPQGSGTFSWTESGSFSTVAVPVSVSNFVGSTLGSAAAAIVNAGLTIGTVTYQNSDTIPAGDVISQTPAANSTTINGSSVTLLISRGPTIPAPSVNLTANQASVAVGGVVTIQWSASNATSCSASGGWSGVVAISGSFTSNGLFQSTTFTLSCSGPGGAATASQLIAVSQAGAIVLSSTTGTIGAGTTLSDGDTSVDFSQDPELAGTTATVQHITAQVVDEDAAELAPIGTDFSNTATERVVLSIAPSTDFIHVSINIAGLPAIPAGSFPAIYVWSDAPATDGDGNSGLTPLPTTYTPTTAIVEANIPQYDFRTGSSLGDTTLPYVAILRIGVAPVSSTQSPGASTMAQQARVKLSARPQATSGSSTVLCPFKTQAGCIETSMVNPSRILRTSTTPTNHRGIDLSATDNTNVYSIPNGQILTGSYPAADGKIVQPSRSAAWYSANKSRLTDPGQNAGISVWVQATLWGDSVLLKYFHLTDVAAYLINSDPGTAGANGGLIAGSVVQSDGLIGMSGHTGSAEAGGPHLHWEMWTNSVPMCTGTSCNSWAQGPVDPFPYLVQNFSIAVPNAPALTLAMSPFTFPLTATDSSGVTVSSNVGHATEITRLEQPGDPTRKVCFYDTALELTYTFNPTNPANSGPVGPPLLPSGNYWCAPWITQFGATSNVSVGPDTTVTAQFTIVPTSPISAAQALSSATATVLIGGNPFVGIVQGTLPLQGFTFACSPGPTCTTNNVTFGVTIGQDGSVGTSPINQSGNWFITNCIVCSPFGTFYDWTLTSGTVTPCAPTAPSPCQPGSAVLQLNYSEPATSQDGLDYCNFTIVLTPGTAGATPTAKQQVSLCNYVGKGVQAILQTDTGPPAVTFTPSSQ